MRDSRWMGFVVLGALACVPGCYRAHERSELDAAARPDAPLVLPRCGPDVREWAETTRAYEGAHDRGAVRLRFGTAFSIAASSPRGPELLTVSDGRSAPEVLLAQPIYDNHERVVIAGARSGERLYVVTARGRNLWRHRSTGGEWRSEAYVSEPTVGHTTAALLPEWMATSIERQPGPGDFRLDSEIDGGGGRAGVLLMATHLSIGTIGDRFAVIIGLDEGESRIVYASRPHDEPEDAGSIGVRLSLVTWDGEAAIGIADDGTLRVRRSDGTIALVATPASVPTVAPSLHLDRDQIWVATEAGGKIELWDERGLVGSRELAGERLHSVMAYASPHHRGAFVLVDSIPALVWVGWSCAP